MMQVIVPDDRKKIQAQIQALEYALKQDVNEKDKQIHYKALQRLRMALNKF